MSPRKLFFGLTLFGVIVGAAVAGPILQYAGTIPQCAATAPSQATGAGYHTLVSCNQLNSLARVDVNATTNPWFLIYANAYGYTVPSSAISSDGTSLTISTVPDYGDGVVSTSVNNLGSVLGGGTLTTGGFYAEIDMKYDSTKCVSGPGSWPAFWFVIPQEFAQSNPTIGIKYTELDVFEYINCVSEMTVHEWSATETDICSNSNNHVAFTPDSNWHTYGVLFTPAGAGTGTFEWFVDNVEQAIVTYTAAGTPTYPSGTCATGSFTSADPQTWAYVLMPGTSDPVSFRNIHIWQAP